MPLGSYSRTDQSMSHRTLFDGIAHTAHECAALAALACLERGDLRLACFGIGETDRAAIERVGEQVLAITLEVRVAFHLTALREHLFMPLAPCLGDSFLLRTVAVMRLRLRWSTVKQRCAIQEQNRQQVVQ